VASRECGKCGGTILAPSVGGARRGSCHCPTVGRVWGRRRDEGDQPVVWIYWFEVDDVCQQLPPGTTVSQAYEALETFLKERV